jgi:hypothetical protein
MMLSHKLLWSKTDLVVYIQVKYHSNILLFETNFPQHYVVCVEWQVNLNPIYITYLKF